MGGKTVTDHLQNAIEAGAEALFEESQELDQENSWDDDLPDEWRNAWKSNARETITAALPHLERHFRELIVGEIRAELPDPCANCQDLHNGMVEAMRIAKEESDV